MIQPRLIHPTRRTALAGIAAVPAFAAGRALAAADAPLPGPDRTLTRIAFGSCAHQDKDQPIWDAIAAARPDLFVFLGDNIYADTRDPAVMAAKYRKLAEKPGFRRFRDATPILAIWDDHDFGENDGGVGYPMKAESRRQFCDFWAEPADSPRRTREGIHAAYIFGPQGKRVQILLPDLRWNRTPLTPLELGGQDYGAWVAARARASLPTPGPYMRDPSPAATMLGEAQWRWLESELSRPAEVRVFASSLQVMADFPGWEAWINFAQDHQRLIQAIRTQRASGLICLSGDTHYAEFSRLDVNTPYPMWDVTSSGLTETWPVLPPNGRRVGEAWRERNFGLIEIDWANAALRVEIRDETGRARITQLIPLAQLQA